jgi:hypothetical protein
LYKVVVQLPGVWCLACWWADEVLVVSWWIYIAQGKEKTMQIKCSYHQTAKRQGHELRTCSVARRSNVGFWLDFSRAIYICLALAGTNCSYVCAMISQCAAILTCLILAKRHATWVMRTTCKLGPICQFQIFHWLCNRYQTLFQTIAHCFWAHRLFNGPNKFFNNSIPLL